MFAVADYDRARERVQVAPLQPADFRDPHRCREAELQDVGHWDGTRVLLEVADELREFRLGHAPVAPRGLPDHANAREGGAGVLRGLQWHVEMPERPSDA